MTENVQFFNHDEFGTIRVIYENGRALFCGRDIAHALGYARPQNAVSMHCKGALKRGIPTEGGTQVHVFIPEGDVYRLIFRSKLPAAGRFESWVCDEVLPQLREFGICVTNRVLIHAALSLQPGARREPYMKRLLRLFESAGYQAADVLRITPAELAAIPGITVPNIRTVLGLQRALAPGEAKNGGA